MEDRVPGTRILIVGGGLAGLFCALECTRNGFSTTVLESRVAVQTAGMNNHKYRHVEALLY